MSAMGRKLTLGSISGPNRTVAEPFLDLGFRLFPVIEHAPAHVDVMRSAHVTREQLADERQERLVVAMLAYNFWEDFPGPILVWTVIGAALAAKHHPERDA